MDQRREGYIEGYVKTSVKYANEDDKVLATARAICELMREKHYPAEYILWVLEIPDKEQEKYAAIIKQYNT